MFIGIIGIVAYFVPSLYISGAAKERYESEALETFKENISQKYDIESVKDWNFKNNKALGNHYDMETGKVTHVSFFYDEKTYEPRLITSNSDDTDSKDLTDLEDKITK